MHEVLVNRLGGLSLTRKSVVRLTDLPDMTLDVYRERKTTTQQQLTKTAVVTFNVEKGMPVLNYAFISYRNKQIPVIYAIFNLMTSAALALTSLPV